MKRQIDSYAPFTRLLLIGAIACTTVPGVSAPKRGNVPDEKDTGEVATEIAQLIEKSPFNVWGLDFSPDGKYLAAVSPSSNEIHVWDWRNRRIVRTLEKVKQGSSSGLATEPLRYSPDGRMLANCHRRAAGNVVIRIWNTETAAIVRDITTPQLGICRAIGFTPDGGSFAWISDRPKGDQLMIHSTESWESIWGLNAVPFYPETLAISPDGKSIALGGHTGGPGVVAQHQILIVDVAQRAVVRTIDAFPTIPTAPMENQIQRLAWHPDGVHVAAGASLTASLKRAAPWPDAIRIFNARSGKLLGREPAEYANIWTLRYTPNGKYLIASHFKASTAVAGGPARERLSLDSGARAAEVAIRIWDGGHRQLLQEIRGEPGAAAVTRDGRYLALGGDDIIYVFQLK